MDTTRTHDQAGHHHGPWPRHNWHRPSWRQVLTPLEVARRECEAGHAAESLAAFREHLVRLRASV